jgi:hypothetical protein
MARPDLITWTKLVEHRYKDGEIQPIISAQQAWVNLSRNSSKAKTRNTATLLNYRSIRKLNVLARALASIEGGYSCLHRIVEQI